MKKSRTGKHNCQSDFWKRASFQESMSANSDEEESQSCPESGGVTNTITSLIELPNKQSQTLKVHLDRITQSLTDTYKKF